MGQQSVRQAARKTALEVRAARRVAGAQCERGLDNLAVELHVALGEGTRQSRRSSAEPAKRCTQ